MIGSMCGIAGFVFLDGRAASKEDRKVLRNMGAQIQGRGPDDEQLYQSGSFNVIFERLSIIDIPGGRQPFVSRHAESDEIVMVVNGEIFNHAELRAKLERSHRFSTQSDCEVLLHMYEDESAAFLERANGMFAFALWDSRRQLMYLGRDRLGIKPLFFARLGPVLLFGSEIKVLLAHPLCPRQFDWAAVLRDPFVATSGLADTQLYSYFEGIEQLAGGQMLELNIPRRSVSSLTYWSAPFPSLTEYSQDKRREREIIEGYANLLATSVQDCTMSHAKIGVMLSGGIDSASVSGYAQRHAPIETYTVNTASTILNGDATEAANTAAALGLRNHQVHFAWEDDNWASGAAWKRLLWTCETPLCGPEQLYKYNVYRYVKSVEPDLKVMLLGQGSDEFNGGYTSQRDLTHDDEHEDWHQFLGTLRTWRRRTWLQRLPPTVALLDNPFAEGIFRDAFLSSMSQREDMPLLWQEYLRHQLFALQMYNLWHEDRIAAANGVEDRVPFLDHRLVEYSMRIPPTLHSRLFWKKQILREAVAGVVPERVRHRPKIAFYQGKGVQYTNWMIQKLLSNRHAELIEEAFEGSAVINIDAVRLALADTHRDPTASLAPRLLRLTNMGLLDRMAKEVPSNRALPDYALPFRLRADDGTP